MGDVEQSDGRVIVGVYHANGGLWGELRYGVGKLFGTAHCALCDITHGGIKEKKGFRACKAGLSLPFEALHLNEQDDGLKAFTSGRTPCVVLRVEDGYGMLLSAEELEACQGSVRAFQRALEAALEVLLSP